MPTAGAPGRLEQHVHRRALVVCLASLRAPQGAQQGGIREGVVSKTLPAEIPQAIIAFSLAVWEVMGQKQSPDYSPC